MSDKKQIGIQRMNVLKPDVYEKLYADHRKLKFYQNDPLISHAIRMRNLIPAILADKHLSEEDKMERYATVTRKLQEIFEANSLKRSRSITESTCYDSASG